MQNKILKTTHKLWRDWWFLVDTESEKTSDVVRYHQLPEITMLDHWTQCWSQEISRCKNPNWEGR